jgi:hypothetical protein
MGMTNQRRNIGGEFGRSIMNIRPSILVGMRHLYLIDGE